MPILEKNIYSMEEDKDLTHAESLGLIEQMITAARNEHREKGDGWLIWGWLLFIASTSSAICIALEHGEFVGWIWTGMVIIGFAIGFFLSTTIKKKNEVTTYV